MRQTSCLKVVGGQLWWVDNFSFFLLDLILGDLGLGLGLGLVNLSLDPSLEFRIPPWHSEVLGRLVYMRLCINSNSVLARLILSVS